jgi:hypothetical protein
MSDKKRWRYGDTNPVIAAVDSATVIEIGDILYLDTDDAKPASSQADQGLESTNQSLLKTNFLGVAMQRSRSGDTDPIRVATTGVFEFECPSSTYELGGLIGSTEASNGTELEDQTLATVATSAAAVARIARRAPSAVTSILVDIRSTIMTGGV